MISADAATESTFAVVPNMVTFKQTAIGQTATRLVTVENKSRIDATWEVYQAAPPRVSVSLILGITYLIFINFLKEPTGFIYQSVFRF